MTTNTKKGCKELLMQRMFLAILSSIVVQFFFLSCLILITNLNLNYTSWIQDTWNTITSFQMWSYFLILAVVIFLQGIICSKGYLNTTPYLTSRFVKLCSIFTGQNLLLCSLYVTIGGLLVRLHLSLKGGKYSTLTSMCTTKYGMCLVEEYFFLLLSGFWSGLYFFIKTNFFRAKYLKFPIIPLSKFFQLKRGICSMLPSLMVTSIWPTIYYLCSYYFLGSYFRTAITSVGSLQLENELLDGVSRLLNLSLIVHLWLYQLIFMLTIESMYLLFQVYLTEWVPFEFRHNSVFDIEASGVTLVEALSMDDIPIMQHLGYLDLVTLAQKDKIRRGVLFTLSQPGGHPYNWNSVIEKCAMLIKKFSKDLSAASVKAQDQLSSTASSLPATSVSVFQKEYVYHMRNLAMEKTLVATAEDVDSAQNECSETFIHRFVKAKWQAFITYLLSKPLVHYVFGEEEASKVKHVLFNAQSVIWAIEAVSSLAVLSLTEDSYGIVQKDLPLLIDCLLMLKQALDKLQKSNIFARKEQGDDRLVKQIFTSLRSATRRSLYRVVTNFETYISDLALEPVAIEQLQSFLNYRE